MSEYHYEASPVETTTAIVTAAAAHGLICLTSNDLVRLLQQAGGGQAQGYAAMANSLDAQSKTIGQQHAFMRELIGDYMGVVKEMGALGRVNFDHQRWAAQFAAEQRQWELKAELARHAMERENTTTSEMFKLVQAVGLGVLANTKGGEGAAEALAQVLSSVAPVGAPAPVAGDASAPAAAPAGAPPAAPPRDEVAGAKVEAAQGPLPLGGGMGPAVRNVIGRLSPQTIDAVLAHAKHPNPKLPDGRSTLAMVFDLLWEILDTPTRMRIQDEVGTAALLQLVQLFKGQPA
jgi:hypothetical protein